MTKHGYGGPCVETITESGKVRRQRGSVQVRMQGAMTLEDDVATPVVIILKTSLWVFSMHLSMVCHLGVSPELRLYLNLSRILPPMVKKNTYLSWAH